MSSETGRMAERMVVILTGGVLNALIMTAEDRPTFKAKAVRVRQRSGSNRLEESMCIFYHPLETCL